MSVLTKSAFSAADTPLRPSLSKRAREVLDWTVFSLGVASLSIAIGATVITHAGGIQTASVEAQDEILVSVLPEAL